MLYDAASNRITLVDVPTMLAATTVQASDVETNEQLPVGVFPLVIGSSTSKSNAAAAGSERFTAACAVPSAASQLLLSGRGLAARDVCHFERKLDSHATRRGLSETEVSHGQAAFLRAYSAAGGRLTDAARRFFRMRSIMGDLTQLTKYEPDGITPSLRAQLQCLLDARDGETMREAATMQSSIT